uniref:ATP synthase subunit a n=1 Tax=Rhagophthalmus giganteus TaxID=2591746 RepID=A0A5C0PXQ5_9COLE|nr:ATP synthase F0 subunit 6 [Rhagophthalmus giganteus]
MTNLFSSFDPSTLMFSLNWSSTLLGILFLPAMFWFTPSRMNMLWVKMTFYLNKEFMVLLKTNMKGTNLIFISLFSFIMFNNFLSLFPYVFSSSSHLVLSLSLSLPLWLSFMIYGWINHTISMFAHLVPLETPPILMPFMVCIETISNIIRPLTLAIRLSANMIAGHILLTIMGNSGLNSPILLINLLIITQLLMLMLESMVAIIQSYVFSILSTLYSSEVS